MLYGKLWDLLGLVQGCFLQIPLLICLCTCLSVLCLPIFPSWLLYHVCLSTSPLPWQAAMATVCSDVTNKLTLVLSPRLNWLDLSCFLGCSCRLYWMFYHESEGKNGEEQGRRSLWLYSNTQLTCSKCGSMIQTLNNPGQGLYILSETRWT